MLLHFTIPMVPCSRVTRCCGTGDIGAHRSALVSSRSCRPRCQRIFAPTSTTLPDFT
uniref:Uncharacterized protein n=1 Tax=Anguilla anguilla TaxID=7936 RepID=A0A0E9VZN8_ANGAN